MKYVKLFLKRFLHPGENLRLIVMEFLFAAKDLGSVYSLAYAADVITGGGRALPAFLLMGIVMLIGVAISATETWCKEKLLVKLRKRLLDAYEEKLMTIKLEKMEDMDRGKLMNSFSDGADTDLYTTSLSAAIRSASGVETRRSFFPYFLELPSLSQNVRQLITVQMYSRFSPKFPLH